MSDQVPPRKSDPIAHSAPEQGGDPQRLYDHAKNVAEMAARFAEPFGAEKMARWLGWWHDAGKAHPRVQRYLTDESYNPSERDHSSAGMLQGADAPSITPALCVAGHHGGLPNLEQLKKRIARKRDEPRIQESLSDGRSFIAHVQQAGENTGSKTVLPSLDDEHTEQLLQVELWTRIVHSALVDADYLDTECHFNRQTAALRGMDGSPAELLQRLVTDQQRFGTPTQELNRLRTQIYGDALAAGPEPMGMFNMTVPTGGGKTRSVMAFALRHAKEHNLDRVIVALPYTSIIDQNAAVYRDIFGSDAVLEHHSAVDRAHSVDFADTVAERQEVLAAENWDAPIVVTTTVQLLETLFSNQNSRLRKLHRYANSVIVLDEVQSIPAGLVAPTMWVLRELTRHYNSSVVLCTATQPGYGPIGEYPSKPIISNAERLYAKMKRVSYRDATNTTWSPERVAEKMQEEVQALVICNTTADAQRVAESANAYYLSTRICQAHRNDVLKTVRTRLQAGDPVHLVSTQVIEAGVDISFPMVLRDAAPLDSIIQSAGRCNRNREQDTGTVIIFRLQDGSCPPPPYKTGREIALGMLRDGVDLNSPDASKRYFETLYRDYPTDKHSIREMRKRFKFEDVAASYRLIARDATDVIVPYGEAMARLNQHAEQIRHLGYMPTHVRRALQPYMVSVYNWEFSKAVEKGIVREAYPDVWIWDDLFYHDTYGLQLHVERPKQVEQMIW